MNKGFSSVLTVSIAALLSSNSVLVAADRTWTGSADNAWSNASNWDSGVPAAGDNLLFLPAPNQTVALGADRAIGSVSFNAVDSYTLNDATLTLGGSFAQNGAGAVTINSSIGINNTAPLTQVLTGVGAGLVTLNGAINGAGGLLVNDGNYALTNSGSTFTGGLTLSGGVVAVTTATGGTVTLPGSSATSSIFGNVSAAGSQMVLDGGELRFNTGTGGKITTAASSEQISFTAKGGKLNFGDTTIDNTAASTSFSLSTAGSGATPAVVAHSVNNSWAVNNALNLNALAGSGAIRFEVTNGAMVAISTTASIGAAITVQGVASGDSASTGDNASAVGKLMIPNNVTLTQRLRFEGAVQIAGANSNTTFDADMRIGSGGDVAVQGRGTGTGTGTPTDSQLTIGASVDGKMITVASGGQFNIDAGFRGTAKNGPVLLNSSTILLAGSTMRFRRSGAASASVVPAIWAGYLNAQGSTANEANLDLQLDISATSGSALSPTTNYVVINGTGFGGLRVSAGGPNATQTSSTRLVKYLTPARTSAISGSGGYLTIAPSDAAFNFTQAHQWSAGAVGLRVENSVAGGADLSFDGTNAVTFSRSLHVGASAQVDVANDTLGGLVTGSGTLAGAVSLAATGSLSPGLAASSVGTLAFSSALSLTSGSKFVFDLASPAASDLVSTGALTLSGQQFSDFRFNALAGFGAGTYTLFSSGGLTGALGANLTGSINGLNASIGTSGGNVVLQVIPEPGAGTLLLLGSLVLGCRRCRR